jgi:hypothetical protein
MPALLSALVLATTLGAGPPGASPPASTPDPLRLLARLGAADPPIAEVQAAAAHVVEAATPDPIELAARRRAAALLPTLTAELRADRQSYHVVGLQASGEVDYLRSSPGTGLLVRATWELGDLVAARAEPVAASAALTRVHRRDEAVRRATHLYFERRRLLLVLALDPPSAPLARADVELDLARATAELEALTGGLLAARGGR